MHSLSIYTVTEIKLIPCIRRKSCWIYMLTVSSLSTSCSSSMQHWLTTSSISILTSSGRALAARHCSGKGLYKGRGTTMSGMVSSEVVDRPSASFFTRFIFGFRIKEHGYNPSPLVSLRRLMICHIARSDGTVLKLLWVPRCEKLLLCTISTIAFSQTPPTVGGRSRARETVGGVWFETSYSPGPVRTFYRWCA